MSQPSELKTKFENISRSKIQEIIKDLGDQGYFIYNADSKFDINHLPLKDKYKVVFNSQKGTFKITNIENNQIYLLHVLKIKFKALHRVFY